MPEQRHGFYAALLCGLPGLAVALLWVAGASWLLEGLTLASLPPGAVESAIADETLFLNEVRNLADGNVSSGIGGDLAARAAEHYAQLRTQGGTSCRNM